MNNNNASNVNNNNGWRPASINYQDYQDYGFGNLATHVDQRDSILSAMP